MKPPHVPIDAIPVSNTIAVDRKKQQQRGPIRQTTENDIRDANVFASVQSGGGEANAEEVAFRTNISQEDVLDSFERLIQQKLLALVPAIVTSIPRERIPLRVRVRY
jgi:hypothetical protein